MTLVANITHDSIDLVRIKFNTRKAPQLDVCLGEFFCRSNIIARRLYIVEERHETVVHVQLLVTVEKGQPRIISNEVYLGFLVSAQHHNIFQDSSGRLPGQTRQLKTMAMEMDWMNIVTGIAHTNTIALALLEVK